MKLQKLISLFTLLSISMASAARSQGHFMSAVVHPIALSQVELGSPGGHPIVQTQFESSSPGSHSKTRSQGELSSPVGYPPTQIQFASRSPAGQTPVQPLRPTAAQLRDLVIKTIEAQLASPCYGQLLECLSSPHITAIGELRAMGVAANIIAELVTTRLNLFFQTGREAGMSRPCASCSAPFAINLRDDPQARFSQFETRRSDIGTSEASSPFLSEYAHSLDDAYEMARAIGNQALMHEAALHLLKIHDYMRLIHLFDQEGNEEGLVAIAYYALVDMAQDLGNLGRNAPFYIYQSLSRIQGPLKELANQILLGLGREMSTPVFIEQRGLNEQDTIEMSLHLLRSTGTLFRRVVSDDSKIHVMTVVSDEALKREMRALISRLRYPDSKAVTYGLAAIGDFHTLVQKGDEQMRLRILRQGVGSNGALARAFEYYSLARSNRQLATALHALNEPKHQDIEVFYLMLITTALADAENLTLLRQLHQFVRQKALADSLDERYQQLNERIAQAFANQNFETLKTPQRIRHLPELNGENFKQRMQAMSASYRHQAQSTSVEVRRAIAKEGFQNLDKNEEAMAHSDFLQALNVEGLMKIAKVRLSHGDFSGAVGAYLSALLITELNIEQ